MANEYVFLDLETTGLDENLGEVLELGILVTDVNFNVLATFDEVVNFRHPIRGTIDDFVFDMHTRNGLWDKTDKSQNSLRGVEKDALAFLSNCVDSIDWGSVKIELSGSTISFDRAWMKKHMPALEDWFHYRNIDVSSTKIMFKKYNLPDYTGDKKEAHRALDDCFDTMHEYRYYLQYLGVLPSE